MPSKQPKRFDGQFHDQLIVVQEFTAPTEDVPLWQGIDLERLTAGDPDPKFLMLPIAEINAKSHNGRYYDRDFVLEFERQAAALKPIGIMGHLTQEQRASAFPPEAVHWVGAIWKGNQLWGKGYIPPGAERDRLARYEAAGKRIATSIDAWASGIWDETVKATRMLAKSLRLNQIDIAPADRAGISSLAAIPVLTAEMAQEQERDFNMPITEAERIQLITELTPDDLRYIPAEVQSAVRATAAQPAEVGLVAELRQTLNVAEGADLRAAVATLVQEQTQARKRAISTRITELATPNAATPADKDKSIKLDGVRGLVVELVEARNPASVEEAERIYDEVVGSDRVKAALQTRVITEMGPNQAAGSPERQTGQPKYFNIPKKQA